MSEFEKFCREAGMTSALDSMDELKDEGSSLKLPNLTSGVVDRTQLYAMNKDLSHLLKDVRLLI
mgnify:FL=1